MGSVFTTSKDVSIKGAFGKVSNPPFYLQFVPGVVVNVVTSTVTVSSYGDRTNVNSIMAIPHIRSEGAKKKKTNMTDSDRYYPLLRGIFEVPAKGDPVLLCTIGGIQYYLGPLNTQNDANFNLDNLWEPEIPLKDQKTEQNPKVARGESLNFKRVFQQRLMKKFNRTLDNPKVEYENHGDIMLEGRHGNSIRVGSRDINPYVYISNGRWKTWSSEGFADGTLISITKKGSLNQHFGGYAKVVPGTGGQGETLDRVGKELEFVDGFILASDYTPQGDSTPSRLMGDLISSVNGDADINNLIYGYGTEEKQNQILASSDRITINSKNDDIYLSSNKDIHIGTKRHLTISTNKNLIIESDKVNIGNPNKKNMEGMVLGEELKTVLKDIVNLLSEVKAISLLGVNPLVPSPNTAKVLTSIDNILSTKHFVETN